MVRMLSRPYHTHLKVKGPWRLPDSGFHLLLQHFCPQTWGSYIHTVHSHFSSSSLPGKPLHASKPHQASPLLWNCSQPHCLQPDSITAFSTCLSFSQLFPHLAPLGTANSGPPDDMFIYKCNPWASLTGSLGHKPGGGWAGILQA